MAVKEGDEGYDKDCPARTIRVVSPVLYGTVEFVYLTDANGQTPKDYVLQVGPSSDDVVVIDGSARYRIAERGFRRRFAPKERLTWDQ